MSDRDHAAHELIVTDAPAASMIPADDNFYILRSFLGSGDSGFAARIVKKVKRLIRR